MASLHPPHRLDGSFSPPQRRRTDYRSFITSHNLHTRVTKQGVILVLVFSRSRPIRVLLGRSHTTGLLNSTCMASFLETGDGITHQL